jgi:hypothetical protein
VALARTNVEEELGASFIRVTRIGELGTTLAVTSNRRMLQEPHGITSQKMPFFIVTAVETSNLKYCLWYVAPCWSLRADVLDECCLYLQGGRNLQARNVSRINTNYMKGARVWAT